MQVKWTEVATTDGSCTTVDYGCRDAYVINLITRLAQFTYCHSPLQEELRHSSSGMLFRHYADKVCGIGKPRYSFHSLETCWNLKRLNKHSHA